MKRTSIQNITKGSVLLPLALLMMGNQQCQQPTDTQRELRRRVEMGTIEAPSIPLPEGGKFDFKYVANAQLYDVLRTTKSFSTSTMDGTHQIEEMTPADRDAFNRCDDDVLNPKSMKVMGKTESMSTVATCMINMPQAVITGDVTGFELTSAAGLSLNLLQPLPLGLSVSVKKATLDMAFKAEDPLIPGHVLATSTPAAKRQEISFSANINFGVFSIGPSAYFKSPLAEVVKKAMVNGITDLKTQMDASSPWYAMVLRNCDKAIYINAGGASDAGLQDGDILEIYNVVYRWEGEVCNSRLLGSVPSTGMGSPIAVARVAGVGDTITRAEIIQQDASGTKIQPGSRVIYRKVVQPKPSNGTTQGSSQQKLAGQK
jgi:hypothetical protein